MRKIKQDIKDNSFEHIYFLYGEDNYMKKLYKEKLKKGLLGESDEMNYSYFSGENIDLDEVIRISETVPFFSDRRVIIIEDSNLCASSNDFNEYIKQLPAMTNMVIIESKVDKRNKLYKELKKSAYVVEMNGLSENDLILFIKQEISKASMSISDSNVRYLLDKVGKDMNNICNECAKLTSYAYGKDCVTKEDIDTICVTLLENKIFEMLDMVATGKLKHALALYNNLIALKEAPAKILSLISRHYNILFKMMEAKSAGISDKEMASILKIPPFAVRKYALQLSYYTKEMLYECLKDCVETEEMFKTGKIDVQIGVEMLIVKFNISKEK